LGKNWWRRVVGRKGGVVKVGWFTLADEAGFIWAGPRPAKRTPEPARSPKAVRNCPAIIDHEARLLEVPCPVDLHLRFGRDKDGRPALVNGAGALSPITTAKLGKLVTLTSEDQWRHPGRPVVQIVTPYRFIADDDVYLNQLPPFHHYRSEPLPGVLIGGRFPIDAWPRPLMWAFEWHEPARDIVLERGEPWFLVRFETTDPKAKPRLVEAELTSDLERFCKGVDAVTNYVNRTFSLLPTARARRPRTLLVERH
jgi:hypothetical protein